MLLLLLLLAASASSAHAPISRTRFGHLSRFIICSSRAAAAAAAAAATDAFLPCCCCCCNSCCCTIGSTFTATSQPLHAAFKTVPDAPLPILELIFNSLGSTPRFNASSLAFRPLRQQMLRPLLPRQATQSHANAIPPPDPAAAAAAATAAAAAAAADKDGVAGQLGLSTTPCHSEVCASCCCCN